MRLTAAAAVLAVLGSVVDAALHDAALRETWWPLLVASWAPPAVAVLSVRTRLSRWVCLIAALLTGLLAVVLVPFGYGIWQLPSVVLLVLAVGSGPVRPRPESGR